MPYKKLIALLPFSLILIAASNNLDYQARGNRHEGIKPKPIGGYNVELLGAMVEPLPAGSQTLPETVSVRFFPEATESVYLTIRERNPKEHYWLDQIQPGSPWRAKATNAFNWPSGDVLRPLGLHLADLVVLVRLGADKPRTTERVAPALLDPSADARKIERYRFVFRTQATAQVRHTVFGPAGETIEPQTSYSRRVADTRFDVSWNAQGRPEGTYRLVLDGYFTSDNQRFQQIVELFHSPSWPG